MGVFLKSPSCSRMRSGSPLPTDKHGVATVVAGCWVLEHSRQNSARGADSPDPTDEMQLGAGGLAKMQVPGPLPGLP